MAHVTRAPDRPLSTLEAPLRQLIERATPDELQAMENALLEPARGELHRQVWLRRLSEAAARGALAIEGVEALLLSPGGNDVIFVGSTWSPELEDRCSALLQQLQEELASAGEPLLQGGFFDRGLEAFEDYERVPLTR